MRTRLSPYTKVWTPNRRSSGDDMEIGSRQVNAQVVEYLARLGMHNWRLSDDERFFLHRYVYLSTLEALKTVGIRYTEQDKLLPVESEETEVIPLIRKETNGRR